MAEEGDKTTTISEQDYNKAIERAQKFEGMAVDLQKKLERFSKIDPDKYHATLEELENFKRDNATGDRKKIDELLANKEKEVRSTVQKTIDDLTSEVTTTKGKLKELTVTDRVFSIAADQINKDCADDVKRYIRDYCEIDDDGNIFARDPKTGEKLYQKGSTTKVLDGEGFAEWLKENRPSWFKATASGGGKSAGTTTTKPSGTGKNYTLTDLMNKSPAEIDALVAQDPDVLKRALS